MPVHVSNYEETISTAIDIFWSTRENQSKSQRTRGSQDQGQRGAVTGGKQLDGFIRLMEDISIDVGMRARVLLQINI